MSDLSFASSLLLTVTGAVVILTILIWFVRWRLRKRPSHEGAYPLNNIMMSVIAFIMAVLTGYLFAQMPYLLVTLFGFALPYSNVFHLLAIGAIAAGSTVYFLTEGKVEVPEAYGAVPTLFGNRVLHIYHAEGTQFFMWWLGHSYWKAPVPKTIVNRQSAGHALAGDITERSEDLGYYTKNEEEGFVYLGARTVSIQGHVLTREHAEVRGEANFVMRVNDPYAWKDADNPLGTLIARFRAGFRSAVSLFNAEDVNAIKSLIPTLLLRDILLVVRTFNRKGRFIGGDVARTPSGVRLVEKVHANDDELKDPALLERLLLSKSSSYLTEVAKYADQDSIPPEVHRIANDNSIPDGEIIKRFVERITLREEIRSELDRVGAVLDSAESMQVTDIALPAAIVDAAARIGAERAEQRSELIAAETRVQTATTMADGIKTPEGAAAVRASFIESGKAHYVVIDGPDAIGLSAAAAVGNITKK